MVISGNFKDNYDTATTTANKSIGLTSVQLNLVTGANCFEDNVGMPGNDIEGNGDIKTKEDCCTSCKNKEGCTFFTYNKDQERCWLKSSDAGRKAAENRVSGSVDCCKGNTH